MALASARNTPVQIPAYHLPVGTGLLPVFKGPSHIDKAREAISNTSDRFMYNYMVSMGETAINMQLRLLALEIGAGNITSNQSWKIILKTLLSEEQLLILSEHYRLREHLLPDAAKCKRWMNTNAYTSKLFLVYIAGYLQSFKYKAPLTWLRCTMIILINGMIDECLNRRVQTGIPKLVQGLPDSSMGASSASSEGALDEQDSASTPILPNVANHPGGSTGPPTVEQLLEQGWKYFESMIDISGRQFWHVVLFTEKIDPISIMRETLHQARHEATKVAANMRPKVST
ncbi:hypothetical protein TWF718_011362 [Orbilia javanica]|uniref:Uncharacterized protein n=1 Tax=Orbilia javanica TaxID=47235 RepID=A0AAN8RDN7_9PEZI